MTNGEKIVQAFPHSKVESEGIVTKFIIDGYSYGFSKCWWEAEYEDPEAVEE
jgi:hypothetical protein